MTAPTPISRRSALAGMGVALTVPAMAQPLSLPFVVIGDWGRQGAHHQREVGAAMGRAAAATSSRFVLSLGDNFYENGVATPDDPQWASSFETIYPDPALMTPWHVILGNHDYRGSVEAQLAYRGSPRWRLPARYYARSERLADGTTADFFHIDTSPFISAYRGTRVRIEGQDTAAQLAWLDRRLGASAAAWKIVVGHHPLFTATGGRHDNPELIGPIQPMLARHGVQAYLGGHIHNLQEVQVDGVTYVTSGAGSELGRVKGLSRPGFAVERHGFVTARLARDALALGYVDDTGAVLRETVLNRV